MTSVLVVGSGAREHAFAWKLRQSADVDRIFVAPGNAGTAQCAENVPIPATDIAAIVRFAIEQAIGLTVVGPEAPLALGLADALAANGCAVVGPTAAAARIEASKSFAKEVMDRAGVPTARYAVFDDANEAARYLDGFDLHASPVVIKADGLAAGKGVVVCADRATAQSTVRSFMLDGVHDRAGSRIVIEEMLEGPEISLLALVDGCRVVPLPVAQDHKRLGDGDTGLNTGGMGAYAPVPFINDREREVLCHRIMAPVVETLAAMGTPFRGILFAGLMLTRDGPRVLEFNCRGGDPEMQVILPLLTDDLLPWLRMTADGRLAGKPRLSEDCAVGVVLAAPGYPERPRTGSPIAGLDTASALVFHAGTARGADGRIVTAGGRVLTVVGAGRDFDEAAAKAYDCPIHFEGMQRRMDIGWQARKTASKKPCPRIAVLASGNGSNLQAIIDAIDAKRLHARIAVVISHNPAAHALDRARRRGIPAFSLPSSAPAGAALVGVGPSAGPPLARRGSTNFPGRPTPVERQHLEDELLAALIPLDIDLIVLAGWMRILSAGFLDNCPCPIINVHPALLDEGMDFPVLRGAHAVRDALRLGLPFTGASVHHVTPIVDGGPVILSQRVDILPGDDRETLHERIKQVEHQLLPRAIQLVLATNPAGGIDARNQH